MLLITKKKLAPQIKESTMNWQWNDMEQRVLACIGKLNTLNINKMKCKRRRRFNAELRSIFHLPCGSSWYYLIVLNIDCWKLTIAKNAIANVCAFSVGTFRVLSINKWFKSIGDCVEGIDLRSQSKWYKPSFTHSCFVSFRIMAMRNGRNKQIMNRIHQYFVRLWNNQLPQFFSTHSDCDNQYEQL